MHFCGREEGERITRDTLRKEAGELQHLKKPPKQQEKPTEASVRCMEEFVGASPHKRKEGGARKRAKASSNTNTTQVMDIFPNVF